MTVVTGPNFAGCGPGGIVQAGPVAEASQNGYSLTQAETNFPGRVNLQFGRQSSD